MLSLRIALRYLLSRKSHGAVNIISAVSIAAIAVAAAAMVIVMSVFNGFSDLASSKLSRIDPDFIITPAEGKRIADADSLSHLAEALPEVALASPEITEQAIAVADGRQEAIVLRGMTPEALAASGIPSITIDGTASLAADSLAIVSVGTAMQLALRPSLGLRDFTVYEPRRTARINPANPMAGFLTQRMEAAGVFQTEQEEMDRNLVIIPYATAASLLAMEGSASAIAVYANRGADLKKLEASLEKMAQGSGEPLRVADRYRQQEQAFRMIAIEKWITWLMLTFIMLIASFNILSTLSMLILEKEPNMFILGAMGATRRFTDSIFIRQGWLIILIGGAAGIAVGALLTLGQQQVGLITLGAPDPSVMSIDIYPVRLAAADLLVTAGTLVAAAAVLTPLIPLLRRR
ncbi:MAG: ABC transporter permease [Muribaculaceae bacterium]|nr:ABC transporter permease [Muribaculaceae bacterium]